MLGLIASCTGQAPLLPSTGTPDERIDGHERACSDASLSSPGIARGPTNIVSGGSCETPDCTTKLSAAPVPTELAREPLHWLLAFRNINVSPGNALRAALQTRAGAPILEVTFTEDTNGARFTRVHHLDGVVERRGHPTPNSSIEIALNPTGDGKWDARPQRELRGMGVLRPLHSSVVQEVVVAMSFTSLERPELWSFASLRRVALTAKPRICPMPKDPPPACSDPCAVTLLAHR
jgi:hypothetical protein